MLAHSDCLYQTVLYFSFFKILFRSFKTHRNLGIRNISSLFFPAKHGLLWNLSFMIEMIISPKNFQHWYYILAKFIPQKVNEYRNSFKDCDLAACYGFNLWNLTDLEWCMSSLTVCQIYCLAITQQTKVAHYFWLLKCLQMSYLCLLWEASPVGKDIHSSVSASL